MGRRSGIAVAVALTLGVMPVLAQNGHIIGQPKLTGSTITGKVAGLGSGLAGTNVTFEAAITFNVVCTNGPGQKAPGHQNYSGSVDGTGSITGGKNGTYTFTIVLNSALTPATQYGCPNDNNWTASIGKITELVSLELTFANGQVVTWP